MPTMTISAAEFGDLSSETQNELMAKLFGLKREKPHATPLNDNDEKYVGIDMEDVADLTFRQIQKWMEAASDKTKMGLKVIAENDGIVKANELTAAGIENLAHFQSRTTIRTRTVTGDRNTFMLGWDDWSALEDGEGRYAVTPITCQSLQRYFKLG